MYTELLLFEPNRLGNMAWLHFHGLKGSGYNAATGPSMLILNAKGKNLTTMETIFHKTDATTILIKILF